MALQRPVVDAAGGRTIVRYPRNSSQSTLYVSSGQLLEVLAQCDALALVR